MTIVYRLLYTQGTVLVPMVYGSRFVCYIHSSSTSYPSLALHVLSLQMLTESFSLHAVRMSISFSEDRGLMTHSKGSGYLSSSRAQ